MEVLMAGLMLTAGCAGIAGPGADSEPPTQRAPETVTREATAPAVSHTPSVQEAPPATARPPVAATPPPASRPTQTAAAAPARPAGSAQAQPSVPKAPALDLTSLEQRLRETKAIGALTKIALKNQVDDLLEQFRTFYQGKRDTDLARLRRSYDLLVMKFLSLLQDEDKPLANAIVASREEIWGLLSDRTKFATL
jgi:hypothetical protein